MAEIHTTTPAWDDARLTDPHGQPDKADRVRAMFDEIAPTYERVNRVLSLGRDTSWRRRVVRWVGVRPDDRVLDLACGTGDLARAFAAARPQFVTGCDFAERMLRLATARRGDRLNFCRGDALALPFAEGAFSIVSCAFGVRNWQNLSHGFGEVCRVLGPGGRFVILEFSMPRAPLVSMMYRFYFRRVLPRLATWISRDRSGAYRYLPASVSSFVDSQGMKDALCRAGFDRVEQKPMTGGIVTAHLAWKP